jgi:hypothetical protein
MRLTKVVLPAAALSSALAHLHAAVFVLAHFGDGVDVRRADAEQHQECEDIPDEEACGHV